MKSLGGRIAGAGRTLRVRLWGLVVLTLAAIPCLVVVDVITSRQLEDRLAEIEDGYIPLLHYGPELKTAVDDLRRALQDAVAAEDHDELASTAALEQAIFERIRDAPASVTPGEQAQVRAMFSTWSRRSRGVARQLIGGATGEHVVRDIETMQRAQDELRTTIENTVFLDRRALATAFAAVRSAHAASERTRVVFRFVLLVAVASMVWVILRRTLGALAELRSGLARFGEGDFSRLVAVQGDDELAELSATANQMAARIDDLQRGLRAKQRELEHANRELEAFSYSVSHDLRAPLRGVDGFSQALLEDYEAVLDEQGRDYLRRVRRAAQRMGELIDDLLALSRISRSPLTVEEVDVSALVHGVIRTIEQTDPARDVEWDVAGGVVAEGDRRLLTIVLENLVGNAWKFTSRTEGARIEFGAKDEEGARVYFVRDNGAGFDMAYADKLFGAFQRLHSVAEFEGTGIGLATVNRVVRRHRGRVWADARVGEGATFYFTLTYTERRSSA